MNETRGWYHDEQLPELNTRLGVEAARDVSIFTVDRRDRLLFPLHLDFAKMPKADPSDQELRQNLSSFERSRRDSLPQGQTPRPVSKINSVSTSCQSEPVLATGTPHQQMCLVHLTFH